MIEGFAKDVNKGVCDLNLGATFFVVEIFKPSFTGNKLWVTGHHTPWLLAIKDPQGLRWPLDPP